MLKRSQKCTHSLKLFQDLGSVVSMCLSAYRMHSAEAVSKVDLLTEPISEVNTQTEATRISKVAYIKSGLFQKCTHRLKLFSKVVSPGEAISEVNTQAEYISKVDSHAEAISKVDTQAKATSKVDTQAKAI